MRVTLCLVAVLSLCQGEKLKRFDNYSVYEVVPTTSAHLVPLAKLENDPDYDFWSGVGLNRTVHVMISPRQRYIFENLLRSLNLPVKVLINDVQELINNERTSANTSTDWFSNYHTLGEINGWLESLEAKYRGVVKLIVGGKSFHRRQILGVHVSFKPENKAVMLEGGIHAREWIAPATVLYILNQLLTSTDSAVRAVAESRDWYIFPSVNPDGYVYTFTRNRMWRKTRKPYGFCFGADPNRNWGYHWMDGGSSSNACSESFAGRKAFSETETKSLSKFINTIGTNLDVYLSFHSYSQLILIPFGHNGREVPTNNEELNRIGNKARDKLRERYGTNYTVGNIPEVVYVASGSSVDWVAATYRQIRLVYAFELRDTGKYGFLLPSNQIVPTGKETLDAVVSMIQQVDGIE